MLVVSLGAWVFTLISASKTKRKDENDEKISKQRMLETGDRNTKILGAYELQCLLWLLDSGEHHFIDSDFEAIGPTGLLFRHIVFRDISSNARDIYVVNSLVWSKRDELLKENHSLVPNRRPW